MPFHDSPGAAGGAPAAGSIPGLRSWLLGVDSALEVRLQGGDVPESAARKMGNAAAKDEYRSP
jgi:hypothetical protein